jgi:predicted dehydrogenase
MVAHVLPFFPEFRYANDLAHNTGSPGRLLAAHFTRVISRPDWSSGISDADRSGGPAIDLHIHDTHFVGLLCGTPRAVHSRGVVDRGAVVHLTTQYLYDAGGPAVSAVSGAICQSGRPFAHGFEIYLEGATLSFGPDTPLTVYGPDGSVDRPALGSTDAVDAFSAEIEAAASAVATGIEPRTLSGELARDALALCHAEVESVKTGKLVELA